MRKRNKLWLAGLLALGNSCFPQAVAGGVPAIIPKPKEIVIGTESFTLSAETKIVAGNSPALKEDIAWFNEYLNTYYHFRLQVVSSAPAGNVIRFEEPKAHASGNEAYELSITGKEIHIGAKADGAGNFYALQSLVQLLPVDVKKSLLISGVTINDAPRFQWRGMHLDVCRHFFPVSFVKRYIDLIALYKMNTFHWHLTDDQGWRIEIKRCPELTRHGAWRKGTMVGRYSEQKYDSVRYGGFYTQEEIKEVVAYAAKKHITVVPEIEMPGHAVAAISTYPWLSCTGKPIDVERGWGVFEDVFCTKDSVFGFLENVLDEVIALFPGKYIHIGGDESPKTRWKVCPDCQRVIKRENLKDEHELQSYFIKRIEKYVSSKGRKIIGWDEILEGGLAPNAAVMSWQGTEGGIAAAKQKHPVVMSPVSHCYFDYYQASPATEPLAIGGYVPLEKVYAFEPVPQSLSSAEQDYIMGAQANVWTEYILSEKQVEYMVLPRMAALAEVLWTSKENRNETDFLIRIQNHFLLLDLLKYNYAKSLYKVEQRVFADSVGKQLKLELKANPVLGKIRFVKTEYEPSVNSQIYDQPILIDRTMKISVALFAGKDVSGKAGKIKSNVSYRTYNVNKATNKKISLKNPPAKSYSGDGAFTLVNSVVGTVPRMNEQWLGWNGEDMEVIVDLEKEETFKEIRCSFLKEELSWIYLPREVELYTSNDGKTFTTISKIPTADFFDEHFAIARMNDITARYIKIVAKNHGEISSGKPGAGSRSWLFCSEIIID